MIFVHSSWRESRAAQSSKSMTDYAKWDKMAAMLADDSDDDDEVVSSPRRVRALPRQFSRGSFHFPRGSRPQGARGVRPLSRAHDARRYALTSYAGQSAAAPGRHPTGFASSKSGPVRVTVRARARECVHARAQRAHVPAPWPRAACERTGAVRHCVRSCVSGAPFAFAR